MFGFVGPNGAGKTTAMRIVLGCWSPCPRGPLARTTNYQGESRMLDSPGGLCAGQAGSEYPATSVSFSNDELRTYVGRMPEDSG
jgi:ABC-type molybdenum transport system ATPase subunit/photorepair protein PhrA